MIKKIIIPVILIAALLLGNVVLASGGRYVMTYLANGTTQRYLTNIDKTQGTLDSVAPDFFGVGDSGELVKNNTLNKTFIAELKKRNLKIIPFLAGGWGDREAVRKMLANADAVTDEIVKVINEYGLDGINVDLENLNQADRDAHTRFIELLKQKMPDKTVACAVAANPYGSTSGWQGSYDYKRLGEICDYLMLMAYDESYVGSAESPVASKSFVTRSLDNLLKDVDSKKVVLGIPFYGRYWKQGEASGGNAIIAGVMDDLMAKFPHQFTYDESKQSAKVVLTVPEGQTAQISSWQSLSSGTYTIWYDNEQAVRYKLSLVNQYDLLGVGSWALGQEDSKMWNYFGSALNGSIFTDISGHWAEQYIIEMAKMDIFKGYEDGTFRPDNNMTRAEGAALVARSTGISPAGTSHFTDLNNHWANGYANALYNKGALSFISGTQFLPEQKITREEFCMMLADALELPEVSDSIFSDVSASSPAFGKINALVQAGIIEGYEDGSFKPFDPIKRGEISVILSRLVKQDLI